MTACAVQFLSLLVPPTATLDLCPAMLGEQLVDVDVFSSGQHVGRSMYGRKDGRRGRESAEERMPKLHC